jgi:glutamate/tyrosine decarboxylase-like PLP-dependent enzyme
MRAEALPGLDDRTLICIQAGNVNSGAFDPAQEICKCAREAGAWVHVDGAFGLWASAGPRYRHLLEGVAAADSWATDGHKWLNVPYDCGYAFVAHAEAHRAAMAHRAPYLVHAAEARDQLDWNPEWSRRARGFATYAALRQLGRAGLADLVERCCAHARALVGGIGALPGVEVLWAPRINQGMVRFLDAAPHATEEDHDRRTDEVIQRLAARGDAFFMGTTWRGRRAMRVSVLNWQTAGWHVEQAVCAVAEALAAPTA